MFHCDSMTMAMIQKCDLGSPPVRLCVQSANTCNADHDDDDCSDDYNIEDAIDDDFWFSMIDNMFTGRIYSGKAK